MMPKLGPSMIAGLPPAVKFGAKFLDKGVKLEKKWVRTQEYAPLLTAAAGFGLIWQGRYPTWGEALWYSSEGVFLDEAFASFFELIDPPANKGGGGGGQTLQLADGRRLLLKRGMRTEEIAAQLSGQGSAVTRSVMDF